MVVSIIVISCVFVALTIAACAVVNRDNSESNNRCSGCPYNSVCKRNRHNKEN